MFDSHVILKNGIKMPEYVNHAKAAGLDGFCFVQPVSFSQAPLKKPSDKSFEVLSGAKVEFDIENQYSNALTLSAGNYDYIVNSVSEIDGVSLDDMSYYMSRSRDDAYFSYLEKVFESLDAVYDYSVLGDLSYVNKYSYYPSPVLEFREFPDIIEPILMRLIFSGKGLEADTSALTVTNDISPSASILKRYCELGGEIITLASHAHSAETVALNFSKAKEILLSLGFKYYSVFKMGNPVMYKL